jgi:F0F1-type ATP synthase membrane subunit b/b'
MNAVIGIITALGINSTIWLQLGIFLFTFMFLKTVVFAPYFRAFGERQNSTQGNQEHAEKIFAQTRELETLYQRKSRSLNAEIKALYDKVRLEAAAEQEKIQAAAREKAKSVIDKAREQIQGELNRAREDLIKEAPALSRAITEKLAAKEVRS